MLPKDSTEADVRTGCQVAVQYNCAAFYAPTGYWIDIIKEELAGSDVLIASAVDFPWGQQKANVKAYETSQLVDAGAQALDICINVSAAKDGRWQVVADELKAFKDAAQGVVTKAIL